MYVQVFIKVGFEFGIFCVKVNWFQVGVGLFGIGLFIFEDNFLDVFGEVVWCLAQVVLYEGFDVIREGKCMFFLKDVFMSQVIGGYEYCYVVYYFGRRGYFDDIFEQIIGYVVVFFDGFKFFF